MNREENLIYNTHDIGYGYINRCTLLAHTITLTCVLTSYSCKDENV